LPKMMSGEEFSITATVAEWLTLPAVPEAVPIVSAFRRKCDIMPAPDDLLHIGKGKINDTRLYRCLDRLLPLKSKIEQHLKQRYGELCSMT
jgi:hypothetical protein